MKARIIGISSIFISILIISGTLVLFGAMFLQSTIFSTSFYQKVTESVNYIPMVRVAIENDFVAQSSYVGIPIENLTAGLDNGLLEESLRTHVKNTMGFLAFQGDFVKATYPEDLFYKPLEAFIQANGIKEGYTPSQEQYTLLRTVAKDSANIVGNHVNLLNMDLVKNVSEFKTLHKLAFNVGKLAWPAAGLLLVSLALLAFLHRKRISKAVLFAFSSFWIAGTILFVPALVMELFGITRRLAIQTAYLKYSVDSFLTMSNRFVMTFGFGLFIVSSIVLLVRILLDKPVLKSQGAIK